MQDFLRMFEQIKCFDDTLRIQRTYWIAAILFLAHFLNSKEVFSSYIVKSMQAFRGDILEFEAKFFDHFRNESTNCTTIWNLGIANIFVWVILNLMTFFQLTGCKAKLMPRNYQSQARMQLFICLCCCDWIRLDSGIHIYAWNVQA